MSAKERFKTIASVYLIAIRDGETLLSRRFQTGYEDGKYSLVAGHMEAGETVREALVREVREEAGVMLDADAVRLALTMHRWCGDHERFDFFLTADAWTGEFANMEPDRCDDLRWFPLNAMPENVIPYIAEAIACVRDGRTYAEYGWDARLAAS